MLLHFILQRLFGDQFASMNLFVVAMSAFAVSSLEEFKHKLSLISMLLASSITAIVSLGLALALPTISELLSYPSENPEVTMNAIVILLATNFLTCLIILRIGNRGWGLNINR